LEAPDSPLHSWAPAGGAAGTEPLPGELNSVRISNPWPKAEPAQTAAKTSALSGPIGAANLAMAVDLGSLLRNRLSKNRMTGFLAAGAPPVGF
jgi:hypothetical protein